jgi:simple sugar transport system ATP-binding protein
MDPEPLIALRLISKRYGPLWANKGISLDIHHGEIHGIVGENGAGKSTLMKVLNGHLRADSGEYMFDGRRVTFRHPKDAMLAGIGMAYQRFLIFPQLTALENVIVGCEPGAFGWINRKQARDEVLRLCESIGFDLSLNAMASELSFAHRQQIEILRLLYRKVRVLILDEPTSLLSPPETERFLELLRTLQCTGHTILFVTHRLQEVFAIADRVSVLSRGELIGSFPLIEITAEQLVQLIMSTEKPALGFEKPPEAPQADEGGTVDRFFEIGLEPGIGGQLHSPVPPPQINVGELETPMLPSLDGRGRGKVETGDVRHPHPTSPVKGEEANSPALTSPVDGEEFSSAALTPRMRQTLISSSHKGSKDVRDSETRTVLLELRNITTQPDAHEAGLNRLSLTIQEGEVFGLGGVVGNGQRTMAHLLSGMLQADRGAVFLAGKEITRLPPATRMEMGLCRLPANPLEEALLPPRSIMENTLLGRQRHQSFQHYGWLSLEAIEDWATEQLQQSEIVYSSLNDPVSSLSGGNLQKLALTRVLGGSPRIVILEQPGCGLDIRAQEKLRERVHKLNASGVAFLVISYDLDELLALSHRVGVLYRGRLMGIVNREEASLELIGRWMLGMEG